MKAVEEVKRICNEWVAAGQGDECFWESWPEEPSEDLLTPNMVLKAIKMLERKAKANIIDIDEADLAGK